MQVTLWKLLAVVIALFYAIMLCVHEGGFTGNVLKGCFALLLPLALIWFPEELGAFKGYVGRGGNIDTETPPFLVSFMGWFILVGLPVLFYLLG